jgi:adenine-specific DNA-methyltransferase
MRFIGSKERLTPTIGSILQKHLAEGSIVGDLFCGTAAVSGFLKHRGYRIIANDNLFFCTVIAQATLMISEEPEFPGLGNLANARTKLLYSVYDGVLEYLNRLPPIKGFIYKNYSLEGTKGQENERNYFTGENAGKIDAIRTKIEEWYKVNAITYNEKCLLLSDLLDATVSVSNTAGTYGFFLKNLEPRALKGITLKRSRIVPGRTDHLIFNKDANELAQEITVDVAYLDPPYNWRQYAAYYHILETIAKYDSPQISGKSGLRPWIEQSSRYSYRKDAYNALAEIVNTINAGAILLSYNADGLVTHEEIMGILSHIGKPEVETVVLPRYISSSGGSDNHTVKERLYYVSIGN